MMLTNRALADLKTIADELAGKNPVELVPMVMAPGGKDAFEALHPGCGLARRLSGYKPGDTFLSATWTANEHDSLPCMVTGVGVVQELGGPIVFVLPYNGADAWIARSGQDLTVGLPWPITFTVW